MVWLALTRGKNQAASPTTQGDKTESCHRDLPNDGAAHSQIKPAAEKHGDAGGAHGAVEVS